MILASCYSGDDNHVLKDAQFSEYPKNVHNIFLVAKSIYLYSCDVLDMKTEVSTILEAKSTFDHRVLQDAHDTMAAYYRFSYDDGVQLDLIDPVLTKEEQYLINWNSWFDNELKQIMGTNSQLVRSVNEAIAFENTERGYNAEDKIIEILSFIFSIGQ